jgi:hypothetical protein
MEIPITIKKIEEWEKASERTSCMKSVLFEYPYIFKIYDSIINVKKIIPIRYDCLLISKGVLPDLLIVKSKAAMVILPEKKINGRNKLSFKCGSIKE